VGKDSIPGHAKGGPCDKGGNHNPQRQDNGTIVCTKCGDTYS